MSTQRQRLLYSIASAVISIVITFTTGVMFITYTVEKNNEALCDILLALDRPLPPNPDAPKPTTPYGKEQQKQQIEINKKVHAAVVKYDCEKENG